MSESKADMKVELNKPPPSAEENETKTPPPPFPKWCENEPQTVTSRLTPECVDRLRALKVDLSPQEESMYCYLHMTTFNYYYRPHLLRRDPNYRQKYKEGMIWFVSTNPTALEALIGYVPW